MSTTSEYGIPDNLAAGLLRYRDQRIRTGGFLHAVLTNNLRDAIVRMNPDVTLEQLRGIVMFLNNEAPSTCWGSVAAVDAWLAGDRKVA